MNPTQLAAFFRDSTSHLLAAEAPAGVRRHVILSIVRSTQFFEFIAGTADAGTVDGVVHATPAHLQPITSPDVVSRLAEVVTGAPINGTVETGGPEPLGMDELVRRLFASTGDDRTVTSDPEAGYYGAKLADSTITPTPGSGAWIAPTTLDAWLQEPSDRVPSPARP